VKNPSALEFLDRTLSAAAGRGLLHRVAEDEGFDGRTLRLGGKPLLHFGSCSYLGLELDPRVRRAASEAALRHGPLFPSSRAYLSSPLYPPLEERLTGIFGAHLVLAATTTLAHLAALPVLCEPGDALIVDHHAHHSVHTAALVVAGRRAHVERLPHQRLDLLDARIAELGRSHRRVWYATDGVYSMSGELAPLAALRERLERHAQLHVYLDDAHGVSWTGRHGCGHALAAGPLHERMCVATTLGKCFGAGGALIVCPNAAWVRRIFTCGGPLIFGGPIAPPLLGAALASAEIHLSPELPAMQAELRERVLLCNERLRAHGLPVASTSEAPVRFVCAGSARVAQQTARALLDDGFFTNVALFPAVERGRAGIRFTLTRQHRREDIEQLVAALDRHLPRAQRDRGRAPAGPRTPPPRVEHRTEIRSVPAASWDRCLGARGAFDSAGLGALERAFSGRADPEDNWAFHYYWVAGDDGEPIVATFFTSALWKHDIFAPAPVSRALEQLRVREPRHLVSRVFAMGSLLTEGNHLYVDTRRAWREPLRRLLGSAAEHAAHAGAAGLVLRDIPHGEPELAEFLAACGFCELPMPEALSSELTWSNESELVRGLSAGARRHYRRRVAPWNAAYTVEVLGAGGRPVARAELERFYALYDAVRARNLALNTHPLPRDIFAGLLAAPSWELLVLRPGPALAGAPDEPVAVVACFKGPEQYVPVFIGLDYRYVQSCALYRQSLRHVLLRARALGARRVCFGIGAPLEKRRFGARPEPSSLFVDAGFLAMLESVETSGLTAS